MKKVFYLGLILACMAGCCDKKSDGGKCCSGKENKVESAAKSCQKAGSCVKEAAAGVVKDCKKEISKEACHKNKK